MSRNKAVWKLLEFVPGRPASCLPFPPRLSTSNQRCRPSFFFNLALGRGGGKEESVGFSFSHAISPKGQANQHILGG